MYAQMDENTGDALNISEPIPLPALNVSRRKIVNSMKLLLADFVMFKFSP
jgi:hypothetical protein